MFFKTVIAGLLLSSSTNFTAAISSCTGDNQLVNPGLEAIDPAGFPAGWTAYGDGGKVDDSTAHGGKRSFLASSDTTAVLGLCQTVDYEQPDTRPIFFSGWSRCERTATATYQLQLDIAYEDGTFHYGAYANWRPTAHDWEYAAGFFQPVKPVKQIKLFALIRDGQGGRVWFDDLKLSRNPVPELANLLPNSVQVCSDQPCSDGLLIRAQLGDNRPGWRCRLLAGGEEIAVLDKPAEETLARWHPTDVLFHWHPTDDRRPEEVELTTFNGETAMTFRYAAPSDEAQPDIAALEAWTVPAARRLYPDELKTDGDGTVIDLALARRERENAQLALRLPRRETLDLQIVAGDLVAEDGARFPASAIRCYLGANLWSPTPSFHPGDPHASRPGWTPEPLIPQDSFTLRGGYTQSVWLEFNAAADQPAGLYRGTVEVKSAGQTVAAFPVTLQVYSFELPVRPTMRTAFAQMDGFTRCVWPEITPELRRKLLDIMLDYKLNPDDISRVEPPAVTDLLYARSRGMNAFCVTNLVTPIEEGSEALWMATSPVDAYGDDFNRSIAQRLDDYVGELKRNNLAADGYLYGFDERGPEYDEVIKQTFRFVKERYPELKTLSTARYLYEQCRNQGPEYQDWLDCYCPLSPDYDPQHSAELRRKGKEAWWYVCYDPRYPYANFAAIDYPLIEGRLLAWQGWQFESDGLLYWHMNQDWSFNRQIARWQPFLDWQTTGFVASGDGNLLYPTPDGPVAGIRMISLRDGIEDYEYLAILARLRGRDAVLPHVEAISRSMTDFSRDPVRLEQVRRRIAAEIEAAIPKR